MDLKKNKISVIVPAYNVEKYIEQCLNSISNQTYRNLEIIVINDGSTDRTREIIENLSIKDQRIRVINQENKGLVLTREVGIKLSTGEYITFVDGDDTIKNDMYERLINNLLKYDADISHCGMLFRWPNGKEELHYGTGIIIEQNNFEGQIGRAHV